MVRKLIFIMTLFFISSKSAIIRRQKQTKFEDRSASIIEDLDLMANRFIRRKERQNDRQVLWWDMYGQNPHLRRNMDFQPFKLYIRMKEMKYGNLERKKARIRSPVSHWLENYSSSTKHEEFVCDYTSHLTHIWKVTKGLKAKVELKAPIGVSEWVQSEIEKSVDLKQSKMQVPIRRQNSFKSRFSVSVPSKTAVSVDCFVTGTVIDIPWEIDLDIEGWIAVWFKEKVRGHYLWFYRITEMMNDRFPVAPTGCSLTYTATGVFRMIDATESNHLLYEHKLAESNATTEKPCDEPTKGSLVLIDSEKCIYAPMPSLTNVTNEMSSTEQSTVYVDDDDDDDDAKIKEIKNVLSERVEQFSELKPGDLEPEKLPPPN